MGVKRQYCDDAVVSFTIVSFFPSKLRVTLNLAALNVAMSGIGAEAATHAENTIASVQRRNRLIAKREILCDYDCVDVNSKAERSRIGACHTRRMYRAKHRPSNRMP
jgi:hypothetical protein